MRRTSRSLKREGLLAASAALILAGAPLSYAGLAEGYAAYASGDYALAHGELLPAAQAGDYNAAYYLGLLYWNGQGVDMDVETAMVWLSEAAAKGHTGAQLTVALAYQQGRGVPQNYHQGVEWLTEAARGGNADAQYLLAVAYRDGRGVVQDHRQALSWVERAIAGDRQNSLFLDSLLFLGATFEWGRGTRQDLIESYKWYSLAAGFSSDDVRIYDSAVRAMDALTTRLSTAAIEEAHRRADEWLER
jgi:TPR repeat protein